jgi:hypothetical protein
VGGLALCGRADAPRRPQVRHQVRAQRIGTHEEHRCNAGQGRASRARACGVCIVAHEWHINVCHNTLVARCVLCGTPSYIRGRHLCGGGACARARSSSMVRACPNCLIAERSLPLACPVPSGLGRSQWVLSTATPSRNENCRIIIQPTRMPEKLVALTLSSLILGCGRCWVLVDCDFRAYVFEVRTANT